jgi:serine/threonine protein kinase
MSPEQAEGDVDALDERTDVYGLGGILYHLLTDRPPFSGASLALVLAKVVATPPTPPDRVEPNVPRPIAAAALRALEKKPSDRYASAAELARDVERFLDQEPLMAYRESLAERIVRFASRHRVVLSLLAAYLLLRALLAILA